MGNEPIAHILDDLGDRIDQEDFGGKKAGVGHHSDRIDNRDGVKQGLNKDFPDRADIAIFDIERPQEEGDAESEEIEFQEEERDEKPTPRRGDAIDEGKNDDNDEVNADVDDGGKGSRYDDDIFGETDFAKEVTTANDGLDALVGAFGEETPENSAGE